MICALTIVLAALMFAITSWKSEKNKEHQSRELTREVDRLCAEFDGCMFEAETHVRKAIRLGADIPHLLHEMSSLSQWRMAICRCQIPLSEPGLYALREGAGRARSLAIASKYYESQASSLYDWLCSVRALSVGEALQSGTAKAAWPIYHHWLGLWYDQRCEARLHELSRDRARLLEMLSNAENFRRADGGHCDDAEKRTLLENLSSSIKSLDNELQRIAHISEERRTMLLALEEDARALVRNQGRPGMMHGKEVASVKITNNTVTITDSVLQRTTINMPSEGNSMHVKIEDSVVVGKKYPDYS